MALNSSNEWIYAYSNKINVREYNIGHLSIKRFIWSIISAKNLLIIFNSRLNTINTIIFKFKKSQKWDKLINWRNKIILIKNCSLLHW